MRRFSRRQVLDRIMLDTEQGVVEGDVLSEPPTLDQIFKLLEAANLILPEQRTVYDDAQCNGVTQQGRRCKMDSHLRTYYCLTHQNQK